MKMVSILGIDFFRVENFLTHKGNQINYNNIPVPENIYQETLLKRFLRDNVYYFKYVVPNLIRMSRVFKEIHKQFRSYYFLYHTQDDKFTIEHYNKGLNEIISFYYENHLQYYNEYQIKKEVEQFWKYDNLPKSEIYCALRADLFSFLIDENNFNLTASVTPVNGYIPHNMTDNEFMEYKRKQYIAYKEYYLAKRKALENKIVNFIQDITWFKCMDNKAKTESLKIKILKMLKSLR